MSLATVYGLTETMKNKKRKNTHRGCIRFLLLVPFGVQMYTYNTSTGIYVCIGTINLVEIVKSNRRGCGMFA